MEFATIFRLTPCKATTVQPSHNKRTVRCAQSCQVRTLQPGKGFSFLYSVSAKPLNMVLPPAMTQFPHICRLPSIGLALATCKGKGYAQGTVPAQSCHVARLQHNTPRFACCRWDAGCGL